MAATSGDNVEGSGKSSDNPSAATRSIAMNGNRIDSRELFAVEREIIIVHGEETYWMRLTSHNKLILTK
jgi:hemin uptake protein HemP